MFLLFFYYLLAILIINANASDFDELILLFNQENFEIIYQKFTIDAQKDYPYQLFMNTNQEIFEQHGKIMFVTNSTTDPSQNLMIVGFSKSLAVGIINWKYNTQQKLTHFHINPYGKQSIVQYLSNNLNKAQITMIYDQQTVLNYQATQYTPIHNFNFIAILLEYSRQVSISKINPFQNVSLAYLNKYYLRNFDFRHQSFLTSLKDQSIITILEIAQGLAVFGSSCNAEFLQEILGQDEIAKTLSQLNITQSKQTYHVSSKIVFSNFQQFSQEDYMYRIQNLSFDNFMQTQNFIHSQLELNTSLAQEWLINSFKDLKNGYIQSLMNNYFTQSNSFQYSQLLKICINKQSSYLNEQAYQIFESLMNATNQNQRIDFQLKNLQLLFDLNSVNENNNSYLSALFQGENIQGSQKQFGIIINGLTREQEFRQYQSSFMMFCYLLSSNDDYFFEVSKHLLLQLQPLVS